MLHEHHFDPAFGRSKEVVDSEKSPSVPLASLRSCFRTSLQRSPSTIVWQFERRYFWSPTTETILLSNTISRKWKPRVMEPVMESVMDTISDISSPGPPQQPEYYLFRSNLDLSNLSISKTPIDLRSIR